MKKKSLLLTALATLGLTAATMAQNVPSYVPTNGLVGWWPFNGNANDESGNGNNGTVNGAILTADRFGNSNKAYSFNSQYAGGNSGNDYIRCLSPGPLSQSSRTISFWVKTDSLNTQNSNNSIVGYGSNALAGQDFRVVFGGYCGSNGLAFHNNVGQGGFLKEIIASPINTWDFYVVVFDSILGSNTQSISIYKNSFLVSSFCNLTNGLGINTTGSNPITFGRYHYLAHPSSGYFKGLLDDIGIWNRALTQQEIKDLYNGNICYQTITVTDTLLINMGITGFNPVTYNNTIKIFPNPTNDHITIDYGNFASLNGYQLKIINSLSQNVFQTNITQQSNYLNLSTWGGNGLYFVQIIDPQGNIIDIRKIVLQ